MTHPIPASRGNGHAKPIDRRCEIRSATIRFAERTVLRDVDLTIRPSDRLAVIGDNGARKSTLLGVIAGAVPLASGERCVALPGGLAVAEQRPLFPERATVAAALDLLLADIRRLEAELRQLAERIATAPAESQAGLLERYAMVVDQLEARDGYRVDLRVDAALEHLGLGGLDRGAPVARLSGGERARLALAAAVSADAELLLLDEPTNDLDDARSRGSRSASRRTAAPWSSSPTTAPSSSGSRPTSSPSRTPPSGGTATGTRAIWLPGQRSASAHSSSTGRGGRTSPGTERSSRRTPSAWTPTHVGASSRSSGTPRSGPGTETTAR